MNPAHDATNDTGKRRTWRRGALLAGAALLFGVLVPSSLQTGGAAVTASDADVVEPVAAPTEAAKTPIDADFDAPEFDDPVEAGAVVFGPDSYFVPISPFRMYDSRNGRGFWFSGDGDLIDALSDQFGTPILPSWAEAVAFNVTVDDTWSAGFVQIYGPGTAPFETSTVNWSFGGTTIANSGIVSLGSSGGVPGLMGVALGGLFDASAYVIIDITGYWVAF